MYLITITIKTDKLSKKQADLLLEQHRNWFKEQFDLGNFLLVGPYKNKEMSGLVVAQTKNQKELEEIIAKDAYYDGNLATYEVNEFTANLISSKLLNYKGQ
ncbi:YciI family protein [Enterococcus faecium]|uniref:YciI family protein n=1 Tax=Enterococcus faecium TaxID=1352 RepID=UPI000A34BC25|nr:YciI family protein [Enterococcus faecium]OTN91541.1 hypothetical protein A5809_000906 [Enterococcus faecium]